MGTILFVNDDCSIVEIAAVELMNGVRTGNLFHSYVDTNIEIHPLAFAVHKLNSEFLNGHPKIDFVLKQFMKWLGSEPFVLVSHNLQYDIRILLQEMDRLKLKFSVQLLCFCTMR